LSEDLVTASGLQRSLEDREQGRGAETTSVSGVAASEDLINIFSVVHFGKSCLGISILNKFVIIFLEN